MPADCEAKLKAARLDLLALFRSIDRVPIDARELPRSTFDELVDLDGDYAEALSILDQPSTQYDVGRMERDTRRSLARLARLRSAFMAHFPAARRAQLEERERSSSKRPPVRMNLPLVRHPAPGTSITKAFLGVNVRLARSVARASAR